MKPPDRAGPRTPLLLLAALVVLLTVKSFAADPTTAPHDPVIAFLNDTVDWYHRVIALQQAPATAGELLLRETARQDARHVVRLGLDFGRAKAAAGDITPTTGSARGRARNLAALAATAEAKVTDLTAELADIDRELTDAGATAEGQARRAVTAARLDLATAQRDALRTYAAFVRSTEVGDTAGLSTRIAQLEKSVPEVREPAADATSAATASATATATAAAASTAPRDPPGPPDNILGLLSEMFSLSDRMRELDDLARDATKLAEANDRLRTPVRDGLMDAVRRGEALGVTTAPATSPSTASSIPDLPALESRRAELESLATRFRRASAVALPLGEQAAVIEVARQDLLSWRADLRRQYGQAARALLVRLAIVAAVVVGLFILSDLWRRATFKYVADARRRRQLMLLRRLVVAAVALLVIVLSVVSEFGSLATFAGLLTAGVAVALQTIILSGVAYFFFIGRFGVRVGDRVTINNITGDVVEIGVFRIYLMELGGSSKTDPQPTGRIVVFSNAVLFQPAAFYKQVPGANYVWHEVSFTLAPDTDYKTAEDRLLGAVESVYSEYRDEIERQHRRVSGRLQVQMDAPRPKSRLRFVDAGLEFVVRYPVEVKRAGDVDDQITRRLLDAVNAEPKLKMVPTGTPRIQPAG